MGISQAKYSLYMAITTNNSQQVQKILQRFPEIVSETISSDLKSTPITRAAYIDRPHIIRVLVQHGADLNQTGINCITALMWASSRGNTASCSTLLQLGADPSLQGPYGLTALDFGIIYGRYSTVWLLWRKKQRPNKTVEDYKEISSWMNTLWVDFQGIFSALQRKVNPVDAPAFTRNQRREIKMKEAEDFSQELEYFKNMVDEEIPESTVKLEDIEFEEDYN